MSRIPRIPRPQPQSLSSTSTPCANAKRNAYAFSEGELSIIEKCPNPVSKRSNVTTGSVSVSVSQPSKPYGKRHALVAHNRLPEKQPRLAKDRAETKLAELEAQIERLENENKENAERCDRLLAENERLENESRENSERYERSERDLKRLVEETRNELRAGEKRLSSKEIECDSLKSLLEAELKKYVELKSEREECERKAASLSCETVRLKMSVDILEKKSREDAETIFKLKSENENLTKTLADEGVELAKLASDRDAVERRLNETIESEKSGNDKIRELERTLRECRTETAKCKNEIDDEKMRTQLLRLKNGDLEENIKLLTDKYESALSKIESLSKNEKLLLNAVQDLKGSIRVYCRIRPLLNSELGEPSFNVDMIDSSTLEIDRAVKDPRKKQKEPFEFDGVFPAGFDQRKVFEEVSTMVRSFLDGYNVCIFAYGQTGSGKTYTMEGENDSDKMGIIPRAIAMIFDKIPEMRDAGWEVTLSASFLEIYNENIYDLLDANKEKEGLAIKMSDGKDVYVANLREENVKNCSDFLKLLSISQSSRRTAATLCNERSSRSHSITRVRLNAVHGLKKMKTFSCLNLVDLAGSESGKTTQRMDETKSINKSLSELANVIHALKAKQSHVPYRNSKLTHLLMPSLGGNSKTLMLVNVSQLEECYQESLNSLRFAKDVKNCKNGVAKKNMSTL